MQGVVSNKKMNNLEIKIKHYCAYQERCLQDVRCKLKEWNTEDGKIELIINKLISEGYIDEERFARAFVRGKFSIKSWGTQKIIAELKKRNVKSSCIKQAMNEINSELYQEKLNKLIHKWLHTNKHEKENFKQKLFRYLLSKGYEPSDIWNGINENVVG